MKLLGKLMDLTGWAVVWVALFYFGYQIGYALVYSPALREVLR